MARRTKAAGEKTGRRIEWISWIVFHASHTGTHPGDKTGSRNAGPRGRPCLPARASPARVGGKSARAGVRWGPGPRIARRRWKLLDQPPATELADSQREELRGLSREAELCPDLGDVGT